MISEKDIKELQSDIAHARQHRKRASPVTGSPEEPADSAVHDGAPLEIPDEVSQAAKGIEDLLEQLDSDIARHPRLAVLAALAAGIVIGSLLSR
jgi:hypothetical protein